VRALQEPIPALGERTLDPQVRIPPVNGRQLGGGACSFRHGIVRRTRKEYMGNGWGEGSATVSSVQSSVPKEKVAP